MVYRVDYPYICGCYYLIPTTSSAGYRILSKEYLQQIDVKAHATILSTISRTTLTQKFVVPSDTKGIKKLKYSFPLFDGVSVVGFKCTVDGRVIEGVVKEREEAKRDYDAAVAKGQTAALMEQLPDASDVFITTIGNCPPAAEIFTEITYLGELKHDAEVDGVRYTIPTKIAARYGGASIDAVSTAQISSGKGKFEVTVDAILDESYAIKEMRSPSHPIAVSMGVLSTNPDGNPSLNQSSATLSLGSTELDTDFVLQIVSKAIGLPKAMLETHPTIPGQRALMATLVPKFELKTERPEIVFVCDRSGSMGGSPIDALKKALLVFLKSLPVGVTFNICSFGSHYSFLYEKSQPYTQQNVEQALAHVNSFDADFGGTEMLNPLKATISQRHKDRNLEVFLVTDGEIWNQGALFDYLGKEIKLGKKPVRVFTLGIGSGASTSLIEGVARAGNGFSQTVGDNEKFDNKVVRMLKGALFPHITDYTLEVKYENKADSEDELDYEIIEKVRDSLQINDDKLPTKTESKISTGVKKVISLFNKDANVDKNIDLKNDGDAFANLPKLPKPSILQAPNEIPPLFPFQRTTAYILLSPEHKGQPVSLILKGTAPEGQVELEFPVQVLAEPGQTIHQLAAKRAMLELDEGHGFVQATKINGKAIEDIFPSQYQEMARRESVWLGTTFQVAGKHCSFVAIEKAPSEHKKATYPFLDSQKNEKSEASSAKKTQMNDGNDTIDKSGSPEHGEYDVEDLVDYSDEGLEVKFEEGGGSDLAQAASPFGSRRRSQNAAVKRKMFGAPGGAPAPRASIAAASFGSAASSPAPNLFANKSSSTFGAAPHLPAIGGHERGGGAFGFSSFLPSGNSAAASSHDDSRLARNSEKDRYTAFAPAEPGEQSFFLSEPSDRDRDRRETDYKTTASVAGFAPPPPPATMPLAKPMPVSPAPFGNALFSSAPMKSGSLFGMAAPPASAAATSHRQEKTPDSPEEILEWLIRLQSWTGNWEYHEDIWTTLKADLAKVEASASNNVNKNVLTTALVIKYLQTKLKTEKDTWELLVEKAQAWLEDNLGGSDKAEALVDSITL